MNSGMPKQRAPLEELARVGIRSGYEMLLWAPRKHVDYTNICDPADFCLHIGERIVATMTVSARASSGKKPGQIVLRMLDSTGVEHRLVTFGNLRFSTWKDLELGQRVSLYVRPTDFNGQIYLNAPELVPDQWVGRVMPVYSGKPRVVSADTVAEAVAGALAEPNTLEDAILAIRQGFDGASEQEVLERARVDRPLGAMLQGLHLPTSVEHAEWAMSAARAVGAAYVRFTAEIAGHRPLRVQTAIRIPRKLLDDLVRELPFAPTTGEKSQLAAIHAISHALAEPHAMDALLTADVGVGKTLCYMVPAVAVQHLGGRTAVLAPNTLLAEQIFHEFTSLYPSCPAELVTDGTKQSAVQWQANPVLIGTTRLLSVTRKQGWHPNLLVIDEQQKLSNEQRAALCSEDTNVLEASATPIPYSVGLLRYGGKQRIEVDKRHAQQDIKTYVVDASARQRMFNMLKRVVDAGHQVAVIYPRVKANSENDTASVLAAGEAFERLCPGQVITLHGQMSPEEKSEAMALAKAGKRSIIVGSSIIEIGITIANLRMLIVVSADRYGVSTLHQFRGRLARTGGWGAFFAYLPNEIEPETRERIELLAKSDNGFELAMMDLHQRGFGDLSADSNDTSGRARTLFRGIELMPRDLERQ